MNDEQSKRIAEAAEAIVQATEALEDAREVLQDRRFESDVERERQAASGLLASRVDSAARRIEDAVRKSAVAAAAAARPGAYERYKEAIAAAGKGRSLGKTITDQDGSPAKRARAEEAIGQLSLALDIAAGLVFTKDESLPEERPDEAPAEVAVAEDS